MNLANRYILAINAGSSSIKFALFQAGGALRQICDGAIDRIGPDAVLRVDSANPAQSFSRPVAASDQIAAVDVLIDWIETRDEGKALAAVGHRVVHGGPDYNAPQSVTLALVEEMRRLIPLDPHHMPQAIALIEAFARRYPDLPQVVCFDTAFFHDLPRVARLLPIPRRYDGRGVRRYGFHGLSYAFLMDELARQAGTEAAQGRVILAHLGNGASLAAVHGGQPKDTSMAFTPAAGVPMGTRSGDLDPGLAAYFARTENMTPEQFDHMVNRESGLLGVSEISSDMRELLARETQDERAAEAVALFCYQIRKWIGAFSATIGGLDQLVFSGGVGENAPEVRARICDGLGFLGVDLNAASNAENAPLISSGIARVAVRVIPTNEELTIARSVARILERDQGIQGDSTG